MTDHVNHTAIIAGICFLATCAAIGIDFWLAQRRYRAWLDSLTVKPTDELDICDPLNERKGKT